MSLPSLQRRAHGSTCMASCSIPASHSRRRLVLSHCLPKPAQRSAVRAVAGQVRETASNGNGSNASGAAADDHSMQEQETPKQQFNWYEVGRRFQASTTTRLPALMLTGPACVCTQVQAVVPCCCVGGPGPAPTHACTAVGQGPGHLVGCQRQQLEVSRTSSQPASTQLRHQSFLHLTGSGMFLSVQANSPPCHQHLPPPYISAGRSRTAARTAWRRCQRESLTPSLGTSSAATTAVSACCCWNITQQHANSRELQRRDSAQTTRPEIQCSQSSRCQTQRSHMPAARSHVRRDVQRPGRMHVRAAAP
jgi:hypothetical protein